MGAAVAALGTGAQAGRKYLAGHTRGVSRKLRRRAEGGRAEARSPSGCGEAPGLGSAAVAEVRSEQEVQLNGWRGWKLLLYCESYLTPSLLFHDFPQAENATRSSGEASPLPPPPPPPLTAAAVATDASRVCTAIELSLLSPRALSVMFGFDRLDCSRSSPCTNAWLPRW